MYTYICIYMYIIYIHIYSPWRCAEPRPAGPRSRRCGTARRHAERPANNNSNKKTKNIRRYNNDNDNNNNNIHNTQIIIIIVIIKQ